MDAATPDNPVLEVHESVIGPDDPRVRSKCILLLTDGQPNVVPPRGHLAELQDYKDKHLDLHFQINTFGFGYSLDSPLLLELAREGNGTFAFIPDSVIVGTTFVNCIANVLSTVTQDSTLNLVLTGGAEFAGPVKGGLESYEETWGKLVKLGPVQIGQTRDVVVPLRIPALPPGSLSAGDGGGGGGGAAAQGGGFLPPYLEAVLVYRTPGGREGQRVATLGTSRVASPAARLANVRTDAVDLGTRALAHAENGQGRQAMQAVERFGEQLGALLNTCRDTFGPPDGPVHPALVALHADVAGRMLKSFNGAKRFNRWGKHYVRALVRAHQLETCTNFMDAGLQPYGGRLFLEQKALGDQIFVSLPPPQPTTQHHVAAAAPAAVAPTPAAVAAPQRRAQPARQNSPVMSTYYAGSGGGCFGKDATVQVVCDGKTHNVAITQVRKGDQVVVAGPAGTARVRCVVHMERPADKAPLLAFPQDGPFKGLLITPGHPMRPAGAGADKDAPWRPARDLASADVLKEKTGVENEHSAGSVPTPVVNLVLDQAHVLVVNQAAECLTWGHGLTDPSAQHAFFGSMDKVVAALCALPGWADGDVRVQAFLREPATDNVVGFA